MIHMIQQSAEWHLNTLCVCFTTLSQHTQKLKEATQCPFYLFMRVLEQLAWPVCIAPLQCKKVPVHYTTVYIYIYIYITYIVHGGTVVCIYIYIIPRMHACAHSTPRMHHACTILDQCPPSPPHAAVPPCSPHAAVPPCSPRAAVFTPCSRAAELTPCRRFHPMQPCRRAHPMQLCCRAHQVVCVVGASGVRVWLTQQRAV